jgi:hypothetical protein
VLWPTKELVTLNIRNKLNFHVAGFSWFSSSTSLSYQLKPAKFYITISAIHVTLETLEYGIE